METFRFLLFGTAGVSVVFWVAVITLWHTYMFPKFFNEDKGLTSVLNQELNVSTCLLYTSPSPRDLSTSRMPSSA